MNHERCRINPNQYIRQYTERLGALAINTALVIKHEINPPKPDISKLREYRDVKL